MAGRIRVGIGGWTFAPWRGPFYPAGLPHKEELSYASRHVTAIEVNGTFYRTQTPASFRKWAAETPDDFVFSLKGHRTITNRKVLAEAGPSLARFLDSGPTELGPKLGPFLWQLAPTKKFDGADIDAFLSLLPAERDGVRLRHALEVRHESFLTPDFVAIARRHGVAIVFADHDTHPAIADASADFAYLRLQRARDGEASGYPAAELRRWTKVATAWASGQPVPDLPGIAPPSDTSTRDAGTARDVFVFFISGEKVLNPAAAQAMLTAL